MTTSAERIGLVAPDGSQYFRIDAEFGSTIEPHRDEIAESFVKGERLEVRYKGNRHSFHLIFQGKEDDPVLFSLNRTESIYESLRFNPYHRETFGLRAEDVIDFFIIGSAALEDGIPPRQVAAVFMEVFDSPLSLRPASLKMALSMQLTARKYLPADY